MSYFESGLHTPSGLSCPYKTDLKAKMMNFKAQEGHDQRDQDQDQIFLLRV